MILSDSNHNYIELSSNGNTDGFLTSRDGEQVVLSSNGNTDALLTSSDGEQVVIFSYENSLSYFLKSKMHMLTKDYLISYNVCTYFNVLSECAYRYRFINKKTLHSCCRLNDKMESKTYCVIFKK